MTSVTNMTSITEAEDDERERDVAGPTPRCALALGPAPRAPANAAGLLAALRAIGTTAAPRTGSGVHGSTAT